MTQRNLVTTMGADELLGWIAYDKSCDPEFRDRIITEIELDRQHKFTAEQEAEAVRNLFRGICGINS